jgi:hypothetical protein
MAKKARKKTVRAGKPRTRRGKAKARRAEGKAQRGTLHAKGRGAGAKIGRGKSLTAADAIPESDVAVETWMFSKDKDNRYVDPTTTWVQFRDGGNDKLRFHTGNMPPQARKVAIEKFAADLDRWLLKLGYEGRDTAPAATRTAVTPPSDPLANLLRAVDANYREAT